MLTFSQIGQITVDLYIPAKRSVITESFRALYMSQHLSAISLNATGSWTISSVESGFSI